MDSKDISIEEKQITHKVQWRDLYGTIKLKDLIMAPEAAPKT